MIGMNHLFFVFTAIALMFPLHGRRGQTAVCGCDAAVCCPDTAVTERSGQRKEFQVNGATFVMIQVKGGSFMMGDSSKRGGMSFREEAPVHQVTLSDYYIGETEVTQALWKAVMNSNPSYFKHNDHPVESVTWDDVHRFIEKLNLLTGKKFRLPTEAEWEYAARGGKKGKGFVYAGSDSIENVVWYDKNSSLKTHPVAQKRANELGLYDMNGNVWEWCEDWYGVYTSNAQTNPTGPATGSERVCRGGSWVSYMRYSQIRFRKELNPKFKSYEVGFRLVL